MKRVNFSDVFNEIYSKHGKDLEKMRKEVLIKDFIILLVVIFSYVFLINNLQKNLRSGFLMIILLMLPFIIGVYLWSVNTKKYSKSFKIKAIKYLVEEQNNTYQYKVNYGISPTEYDKSLFDISYDNFFSEDYIDGFLGEMVNFRMSQVKTVKEHVYRDRDGHRKENTVVTFLGLYGEIELPVLSLGKIEILGNSKFKELNRYRVNVESEEFEKYYDVLADDKVWAMQILTSETIEAFVELRKFFKKSIQVKIIGNKIYFRLDCGDIFEPPKLRNSLNFNLLYKYYRIIDIPRYIYEAVIDNIANNLGDIAFSKSLEMDKMTEEEKQKIIEQEEKKNAESWFENKGNNNEY